MRKFEAYGSVEDIVRPTHHGNVRSPAEEFLRKLARPHRTVSSERYDRRISDYFRLAIEDMDVEVMWY